ncbi:hypothetical protein [Paenibacillus donghaensis]|uniref:Uncharacterized protein n=1 Tax=Paenibacillus donghaensis TaxID=414771 RepID=A0A2Z2KG44_9BACL|nr:hypothetical protein [Paenibacillus donghaensis]ASA24787.1 hypothetical protein B9T62_30935 [Paenibacillus donghaensis]
MIKSGKIFFKSMAVIAVLLLTFAAPTKVTFAKEVLTVPEPTSISILPTETSADYLSDVKEMLILMLLLTPEAFGRKLKVLRGRTLEE